MRGLGQDVHVTLGTVPALVSEVARVRVDVPPGLTVAGDLVPVLGGLGPVRLRFESIQGCFVSLLCCGVTTSSSAIAGIDEICAVTGTSVSVAATPDPVDPGPATVRRGVRDRSHPRHPFTQLRRAVACPGGGVAMIRRHIPPDRLIQEPVDLGVPVGTVPISFIGDDIALISSAVPGIGRGIPLVRHLIAFACGSLWLSLRQPMPLDVMDAPAALTLINRLKHLPREGPLVAERDASLPASDSGQARRRGFDV
jgi:hypothetical protein